MIMTGSVCLNLYESSTIACKSNEECPENKGCSKLTWDCTVTTAPENQCKLFSKQDNLRTEYGNGTVVLSCTSGFQLAGTGLITGSEKELNCQNVKENYHWVTEDGQVVTFPRCLEDECQCSESEM